LVDALTKDTIQDYDATHLHKIKVEYTESDKINEKVLSAIEYLLKKDPERVKIRQKRDTLCAHTPPGVGTARFTKGYKIEIEADLTGIR